MHVCVQEGVGAAPVMLLDGPAADDDVTGRIVAEGQLVCTTEGLLQTYAVWFATYYAFNCCYPEKFRNSLAFIQKILMGLKCSLKTPLVTTVLKKISASNI